MGHWKPFAHDQTWLDRSTRMMALLLIIAAIWYWKTRAAQISHRGQHNPVSPADASPRTGSTPQRVAITFCSAALLIAIYVLPVAYIHPIMGAIVVRFSIWAVFPLVFQDHDRQLRAHCERNFRPDAIVLAAEAIIHLVGFGFLESILLLWRIASGLREFCRTLSNEGLIALIVLVAVDGQTHHGELWPMFNYLVNVLLICTLFLYNSALGLRFGASRLGQWLTKESNATTARNLTENETG